MRRLAVLVGTVIGSVAMGAFACLVLAVLPVTAFRVAEYLRWYEVLCLVIEAGIMCAMYIVFIYALGGFVRQAYKVYKAGG